MIPEAPGRERSDRTGKHLKEITMTETQNLPFHIGDAQELREILRSRRIKLGRIAKLLQTSNAHLTRLFTGVTVKSPKLMQTLRGLLQFMQLNPTEPPEIYFLTQREEN